MRNAGYAAVWLLVLVIPLENAILIPGVGTLGRMTGILALAMGGFALVAQKKEIRLHPALWLMLVFVLLCGTSFFWTIDPENTIKRVFTYFQNFLMMWLIFQWCDDEKKVHGLYLAFILGSLGLTYGIFDQFLSGEIVVRVKAYNFNPNEIASILSLSIPFAWYLFLVKRGPVRWGCVLILPAVSLAMLLTGSRAGFVKGLMGVAFILLTPPPGMWRTWGIVIGGSTIAAIVSIIQFLPEYTLNRLLSTQAELVSGDLGGRGLIWSTGLEVFSHHPVFGVGAGTFSKTMTPFFTGPPAPHNVFVSLLVDHGVVGLVAFGAIALTAVGSILRLAGIELRLWITVFGIWGACIMTSNWEWRKQMWLLLILAVTHGANSIRGNTVYVRQINRNVSLGKFAIDKAGRLIVGERSLSNLRNRSK